MPKIKSINLESAVEKILKEYAETTTELTKDAVKEVVKVGAKKVKENASVFNGTDYAKGWTSLVEEGRLSAQGVIYNSTLPGLPHLLEKGHANRDGGRTNGVAHISPVEDELEELIMQKIEEGLG